MIVVFPGTFDPITYAHINVYERASKFFDKLIIACGPNSSKNPIFSLEERIDMIKHSMPSATVGSFEGLLLDYLKKHDTIYVVKGLRDSKDFEYELHLHRLSRMIDSNIETVCLFTDKELSEVSSSVVRDFATHHSDVSKLVPPYVEKKVREKFSY